MPNCRRCGEPGWDPDYFATELVHDSTGTERCPEPGEVSTDG
jgi:hypothetical protein